MKRERKKKLAMALASGTLFADLMTGGVFIFAMKSEDTTEKLVVLRTESEDSRSALSAALEDGVAKDGLIDALNQQASGYRRTIQQTKQKLGTAVERAKQQAGVIRDLKQTASGNQRVIDEQAEEIVHLAGERDRAVDRLRSGPPMRLTILIDVTGSMRPAIDELRVCLATSTEVLPHVSKRVEIACIAFRNGIVSELPMMEVEPSWKDQGASQQTVLDWVDGLSTKAEFTEHRSVFEKAFNILMQPSSEETIHRLIFIGDVGPAEIDRQLGYTAREREEKAKLVRAARRWCAMRPLNGVTALYADTEWAAADPYSEESREWFRELGRVSPNSQSFESTGSMLRAVLQSSLQ